MKEFSFRRVQGFTHTLANSILKKQRKLIPIISQFGGLYNFFDIIIIASSKIVIYY